MFGGLYSQTPPSQQDVVDDYPRLGGYLIGTRTQHQDPRLSIIANFSFAWINPQQSRGASFVQQASDFITRVRAINPDFTVYIYTDLQEASFGGGLSSKLLSETGPPGAINNNGSPTVNNNWFAVDEDGEYTGTGFFGAPGSGDLIHTNITTNVTPDSFGKQFPQYYAEDHVIPISLAPHNGAGVVAHIGNDVTDHRQRENGQDLDGNGNNDNARSNENLLRQQFREGHKLFFNFAKSFYNNEIRIAINGTTHSAESTSQDPDYWGPGGGVTWSHYDNVYHGALMEGQSQEVGRFPLSGLYANGTINTSFGSRRRAQNAILFHERFALAPKHNLNQWEIEVNPVTTVNPVVGSTVTSAALGVGRAGLADTCMCDAYFYLTEEDATQYDLEIELDEFGTVNQGTTGLTPGWLGQPIGLSELQIMLNNPGISPVTIGTDNNGLIMREFDNGIVIRNTSTTTDIAIDVVVGASSTQLESGDYIRISGFQDNSHNTGLIVNTTNDPSGLTVPRNNAYFLRRL